MEDLEDEVEDQLEEEVEEVSRLWQELELTQDLMVSSVFEVVSDAPLNVSMFSASLLLSSSAGGQASHSASASGCHVAQTRGGSVSGLTRASSVSGLTVCRPAFCGERSIGHYRTWTRLCQDWKYGYWSWCHILPHTNCIYKQSVQCLELIGLESYSKWVFATQQTKLRIKNERS